MVTMAPSAPSHDACLPVSCLADDPITIRAVLVLGLFEADGVPLSRGQIASGSGLKGSELDVALAELCRGRQLCRLNTIIESYLMPLPRCR